MKSVLHQAHGVSAPSSMNNLQTNHPQPANGFCSTVPTPFEGCWTWPILRSHLWLRIVALQHLALCTWLPCRVLRSFRRHRASQAPAHGAPACLLFNGPLAPTPEQSFTGVAIWSPKHTGVQSCPCLDACSRRGSQGIAGSRQERGETCGSWRLQTRSSGGRMPYTAI